VSALPVRVLVVEDFEPWRRSVCSVLKRHAELQLVGEAADGLAAVHKAGESKPDLVLLDIGLPKLNGIAQQICQVLPSTKILFLTVNSDVEVVEAALSNGAQGYVLKTDAESELWPAIDTLVHNRKYVSSRVNLPLSLPFSGF